MGGKPKWLPLPPWRNAHKASFSKYFCFTASNCFYYPAPSQAHFLKVDFNKWCDSDDEDDGGLDDAGFDAVSCDCFPERCLAGRAQEFMFCLVHN